MTNEDKILNRLDVLLVASKGLANKDDVKSIAQNAALLAIRQHENDKHAPLNNDIGKLKEETSRIAITQSMRRSMAPAGRALAGLPQWAKILVPVIVTAIGSILGADLSGLF